MAEPLLIAKNEQAQCLLLPELANRHGLITGATGTGKTVTLQTLAEQFSRLGVAVFMADVKGDLTGISQPGKPSDKLKAVLAERGLSLPAPQACPTQLWDVFGEQGHPVRATISDMGPLLLGRMLGLNETQAGVLNLVFRIADDQGLLLLDLKDLRAMLQYVGDNAKDYTTRYGNISSASVGAIARGLLHLESQGGTFSAGETGSVTLEKKGAADFYRVNLDDNGEQEWNVWFGGDTTTFNIATLAQNDTVDVAARTAHADIQAFKLGTGYDGPSPASYDDLFGFTGTNIDNLLYYLGGWSSESCKAGGLCDSAATE
jgi:hypothetical protein